RGPSHDLHPRAVDGVPMKNRADYSQYECPYSHLEKECGHKLEGPEGYENTHGVWCACGFRGPVFYLEPEELKLKKKDQTIAQPQPKCKCSSREGIALYAICNNVPGDLFTLDGHCI